MKLQINKKSMRWLVDRRVAVALLASFLLVGGTFWISKLASSDASSPTKSVTDIEGNKKDYFNVGDQGYLNLKVYADSINGFQEKSDVVLLVDGSLSMTDEKLTKVRSAITSFVNSIDYTKGVRVGLVVFSGKARCGGIISMDEGMTLEKYPVTAISSDSIKNALLGKVDELTQTSIRSLMGSNYCLTGSVENSVTGLGKGLDDATTKLDAVARTESSQNIILFSDGEENAHDYSNGTYFNQTLASNAGLSVTSGSPLSRTVASSVRVFPVHYGISSNTCSAFSQTDPYVTGTSSFTDSHFYNETYVGTNNGCSLMRFIATKTNGLVLPSGKNYLANYGQATSIDGSFFHHVVTTADNTKAMTDVANYIFGVSGVPIKIYEKIDSHASYEGFMSAVDKGGRSYVPSQSDGTDGDRLFYFSSIPKSYYCDSAETKCLSEATKVTVLGTTKYLIENNYVELKLKFSASSEGKFDIDSNYNGCDVGKPVATGNWFSKLEYQDPRNSNSVYATKNFPVLCMEFSNGATVPVNIMKTTYSTSQTLDDLDTSKMKAYFEAGDTVFTVLEVVDSSQRRADFEILDELPNSASGNLVYKITREGDGKNFTGSATIHTSESRKYFRLTPSADDIKSPAYLLEGKTIIQYEYKI